ncbi:MAG: hypothetical protein ACRDGL_11120 [Candidatus Limnocylindrales bacterium]
MSQPAGGGPGARSRSGSETGFVLYPFEAYAMSERRHETPEESKANWAAYLANFRLSHDQRGAGFTDSTGEWHAMPEGVRTAVAVNRDWHYKTLSDTSKVIVFLDDAGRALLVLPYYALDPYAVEQWASAAGYDSALIPPAPDAADGGALAKRYPGVQRCPVAPVGAALMEPGGLARQFARAMRWRR